MGIATFIHASPQDLIDTGIRRVFDMARRLKPTILFLEDLDFIARDRRGRQVDPFLGEMLVQLDGIEENDGLVVIGTTNDIESIDSAIKERPSRFDVVIQIGEPATKARSQIIQQMLNSSIDPSGMEIALELTQGFSGAQVQEFCIRVAAIKTHRSSTGNSPPGLIEASEILRTAQSFGHSCGKRITGFAGK
jgi:SpoVK/Ycf46/Vps4 family AAA+-type ATPase